MIDLEKLTTVTLASLPFMAIFVGASSLRLGNMALAGLLFLFAGVVTIINGTMDVYNPSFSLVLGAASLIGGILLLKAYAWHYRSK